MAESLATLTQRADYTQKHHAKTGRYGWLRLTPAYSLKIVKQILDACDGVSNDGVSNVNVLDPFCGTGTTALCATYHGRQAVTTDINPFLVWLSQAKTDYYSPALISELREQGRELALSAAQEGATSARVPPMHNIERWWNPLALVFLCRLKGTIDAQFNPGTQRHSLLLAAFCRTLIDLSNAAFNHQSMSFKANDQALLPFDCSLSDIFLSDFLNNLDFVLEGAKQNPAGKAQVLQADARTLCSERIGKMDCVITSPPYVNRMSYIRELRPYMYWLGYLLNGRDAGEMDWEAIGGTWGVATSRLNDWSEPNEGFKSKRLQAASAKIDVEENKNGRLLAAYVLKYCDDMWRHFQSLAGVLSDGASIHYIVGNSTFYGVLVSVERVYAEMLSELGFNHVECVPIRKRNSKKALIEFDVRARWR